MAESGPLQLLNNSDFAKSLVENEGIGQDDIPDYLSISFSSVDAVNHFFGPSSLENEDVVLQLDRTIADLISFIDRTVGLDSTLIVLSADHGMPEAPEFMAERALELVAIGVAVIGGCCGTTPEHIAALRRAVDRGTGGQPTR